MAWIRKEKVKTEEQKVCTCRFFVEAIPLHLAAAHITTDKVSSIAQEHSVADCVNVWGREVCNASVACVLTVCWCTCANQLCPDL